MLRPIINRYTDLTGLDLRLPALRRETFLRLYEFNTVHRLHDGCDYFIIPAVRDQRGYDDDSWAWWLWLQGQTGNAATTMVIHDRFPRHADADAACAWVDANHERLEWVYTRRHQRAKFAVSTLEYADLVRLRGSAAELFNVGTWEELWEIVIGIPGMGRPSAWAYLEHLYIGRVHDLDAPDLMLERHKGSAIHRDGLCLVTGNDAYVWRTGGERFEGQYTPELIEYLRSEAALLLVEGQGRMLNNREVTNLSLESALVDFEAMSQPSKFRHHYPGVHADVLHDKIIKAQRAHPDVDLSPLWVARASYLPEWLRAEARPPTKAKAAADPEKGRLYSRTGRMPDDFAQQFPDMGGAL